MLTSIGMTPSNTSSKCPVIVPAPPSDLRKVIADKEKLDTMCALVVAQRTIVHPGTLDNFFCLTRFEVGVLFFQGHHRLRKDVGHLASGASPHGRAITASWETLV